jgi:transcriptional regulator with PAS, ATPase and Fis domain
MLFSSAKKATTLRKQRLKTLQDTAQDNRKEIERKLKEAKAVDQQLAQVLSDTHELTSSIQEKLASHLKITRNTLKNICHNVREGIVILDNEGKVIEANEAFIKMCIFGDELVGTNFKSLCMRTHPTADGKPFEIDSNFKGIAEDVFKNKKFAEPLLPEVVIEIHPEGVEPFKCTFAMTTLDNSPEHVDDVSFILFFRCLKRASDSRGTTGNQAYRS